MPSSSPSTSPGPTRRRATCGRGSLAPHPQGFQGAGTRGKDAVANPAPGWSIRRHVHVSTFASFPAKHRYYGTHTRPLHVCASINIATSRALPELPAPARALSFTRVQRVVSRSCPTRNPLAPPYSAWRGRRGCLCAALGRPGSQRVRRGTWPRGTAHTRGAGSACA